MVSTFPGYRIYDLLYNGSKTLVYRGYRETDSLPVVIKLLKNPYPNFSELLSFRNQYTIAKNLNSPLIVQTYNLEHYQNGYALVMEDFGGISLKEWGVRGKGQSLQQFLEIAIALCNTLDILYRLRIIHKDINPANILINLETKQVKLIDFSIASLLPRETQTLINPNVLEGTLAYISPEQTGRMNRGIDYRTDFYSLGVTFYELLTGELPFQSNDSMELVHCHIAKLPPMLGDRREISQVLCDIVIKLMAKNAEDRYQSALGIKFDLENCLTQLQETGSIENFEIAQRDVCDRFIIPDKLYGRETEVSTLLQAFERVSLGATEMMLVAGFSGIGKTAVVNEVHKPIVRQRGYFIKGKYDQFQRNIPFSAFVQAFRDLMGQLLTESDAQIEQWKNQILSAVGENGQVIIEVIPELSKIIGEQPPAIELSGTSAQNRFNLLFQKFTQVFTSAEHPLVMFLDDLQWADSASLKLIQLLMADTKHMLLIGAYRDNEVTPAHPLMLTLSEIQKSQATINTITLAPLSQEQVNQLVGDTLKCTETLASPLSQLIYQKTQGNPFFATQFLKALHQDGLIEFNFESGYWQCDITQVTQQALTDDVVAFMAFQLRKLPQSTQNVLQLAACIGNKFDLATLAIVSESSSIETATCLWKALQEGLILPISDVYKFYQEYGSSEWEKKHENSSEQVAQYKFLHDRVQQAAYSLILDEQKQATHLKIGQLLQENSSEIEREEKLFDIVGHLNLGQGLINQQQEREDLAQLNLKASSKARNSTAYAAAKIYLQNGIELLQSDCWQSQYQLTLKLYIAAAEANYLTGSFEKTQQWTDIILENAKSLLDRIEVYEIQLSICIAQERFTEAIEICLQTLKLLEVNISNFPTDIHVEEAFANITNLLHEQKIEDLFYLPTMTDAYILAAMRFLNLLVVPAYQTSPNLFLLTVVSAIELSIKYGNSSSSATFYSLYGMVLCCISNDIERGYEFGTLALNLLNQLSDKQFHSRTLLFLLAFIKHWKSHPKHSLLLGQSGYQIGLETGDLENTAWNCFHECQTSYLIGQELSELKQKMQARSNVIQQTKHQIQLALNEIQRQAVLNIIGNIENPCYLIGEAFNEEELLPKYQKENSIQVLHCIYLHKLILCFLFGEYSLAVDFSTVAAKYIGGVLGQGIVPVFYYYESLASLAVFFNSSELEQQNTLELIRVNQKKLGEWAHHAPMNHQHKVDLVSAEKCRVLGQKAEAIEFYDKAISGAKENGYIQEEALANELAAKFYLDWGKEKVAQAYIQEAYYCYARWGAKAKVADLERGYPQLLAPILQQTRTAFSVNETVFPLGTVTSTSSSTSIFHSLDLAAILKASQTISSEIELGKLLSSLLRILIENAGANKCVLMLMRDERLLIKGSIIEGSEPIVLQPLPIEDSQDIPLKMIYKVKNNKQTVVLLDATADPTLANDPYIMRQQPYSILCSPILHQGKFLGILYLENNLATRAFTSERVELLNLLCAQAAISIENAQLYQRSLENAQQLERSFAELQQKSEDLQQAQLQIVQSEKMSALGNLVAGVAHEMNNPLGFISASLQQAKPSLADIVKHFKLYEESFPNPGDEIIDHAKEIDLGYTLEDLPKIIDSMVMACDRLENISTSLRTFSRADKDYKVPFNIHEGIDSTILILKHRLKANEQRPAIEVITDYGNFPQVKCFPGQLNQVFMNILANAIDVLDESNTGRTFKEIKDNPNRITIKTSLVNEGVKIAIVDNGKGMSESVKQKIFDHLFTTKAVGKGTGLGLAIARQIIEETHGGKLNFNSVLGEGTEFIITIPL